MKKTKILKEVTNEKTKAVNLEAEAKTTAESSMLTNFKKSHRKH